MAARKNDFGYAMYGGMAAGAVGALFLTGFMALMALAGGQDVWMGMKGAAAPFLGEAAMKPGFDLGAVVAGRVVHGLVSIGWGGLFGLLFYGLSKGITVLSGVLWGLVVWIGMFYMVLPMVGMGEVAAKAPVGMVAFQHVLFGVVVAIAFLPFQHHVPRYRFAHAGG